MKKFFLLFVSFLIIDCIFYWGLWNTYFQQDEWLGFGQAIYQMFHPLSIFQVVGIHFFPLGNLVWLALYSLFGLHAIYYGIISLILHALTTTIAFYVFQHFTKNNKISFIFSILFSVSFPSRQVVVWYAVLPSLVPGALLILLYFLILIKSVKKNNINIKTIILLISIFICSVLLKEDGFILLPVSLLYVAIFSSKPLTVYKQLVPLYLSMVFFFCLRFLVGMFYSDHVSLEQGNFFTMTLYNMFMIPPKMIVQNLIEYNDLITFSSLFTRLSYPRLVGDGLTVITAILDQVVLWIFLPIVGISITCFTKMNKERKNLFIFSLIWILMTSWIISPQGRHVYSLESRYLFISDIGVLLFLYVITYEIIRYFDKLRLIYFSILTILLIGYIGYTFIEIQTVMQSQYIPDSTKRESIVNQIQKMYPSLGKNAVFYVNCAKGVVCNDYILPFQSGFGQLLLVIYGSQNKKAYAPFLSGYYLWDTVSEGYKQENGYGFGYVRSFEKVKELVKQGKVLPSEVISLTYNPVTNKVSDTSKTVRDTLNGLTLE